MNNVCFPPLTINLNLPNLNHKRTYNPSSISIKFYLCLVPLTRTRIQMITMTMRREETRSKSRQCFPTVPPTRSRNRSNWGVYTTLNYSWAVTRRRALAWPLFRSPTCGVAVAITLWSGMGESKRSPWAMTTCPIIGQAGGGAVAD